MPKHPATFSPPILGLLATLVEPSWRVLDPFAGTGKIHLLPCQTVGVEIEPEWAAMSAGTIVGNALTLPFRAGSFDAVVTSPTYGNRFADHHNARDGSVRRSYTHDLGRPLHLDNSGAMQWGPGYWLFHRRAWAECARVAPRLILNISDHVRKRETVPVSLWHLGVLYQLGYRLRKRYFIPTQRMRYGANPERVEYENVFVLYREKGAA